MKTRLGTSKDDARIYSPGRRELLGLAGVSLLAQACGVGEGDGELEVVAQDRAGLAVPPERTPESNAFAMGVACGDVTAKDAIVWTQWSGARELELAVYRVDGNDYVDEVVATAVPVEDAGFVQQGRDERCKGLAMGGDEAHRVMRLRIDEGNYTDFVRKSKRFRDISRHDARPAPGAHVREQHDHRVGFKRRFYGNARFGEVPVDDAAVLHVGG